MTPDSELRIHSWQAWEGGVVVEGHTTIWDARIEPRLAVCKANAYPLCCSFGPYFFTFENFIILVYNNLLLLGPELWRRQ